MSELNQQAETEENPTLIRKFAFTDFSAAFQKSLSALSTRRVAASNYRPVSALGSLGRDGSQYNQLAVNANQSCKIIVWQIVMKHLIV